MKLCHKLLIFVLVIPVSAQAWNYYNAVGLYDDLSDLNNHRGTSVGGLMSLFLVLTQPHIDVNTGAGIQTVPVEWVTGFSLGAWIPEGMYHIETIYPLPAENHAVEARQFQVTYTSPVPVTDSTVVLAELVVVCNATANAYFYLDPLLGCKDLTVCAATRQMSDEVFTVLPVSGDSAEPVFVLNWNFDPDPLQSVSWGSVKSLYR